MGCDIHMVLERKVGEGGWVGIHNFPYYRTNKGHHFPPAESRNYARFAKLAGVRGEGPEPRGIPEDVSVLAQMEIDRWGDDGHSHSWMSIREAAHIFAETEWELDDYAKKHPACHYFGLEDVEIDNHRIIFFFDN